MRFKNYMVGALLLVLAGCGCGDDSIISQLGDGTDAVVFNLGALVPPCEVEPPPAETEIRQIDVFFVIDDGWSQRNRLLGLVPENLFNDPRTRILAAREIMKNLEDRIMGDIAAELNITVAEAQEQFDLAFGVGGLCDFGGPFATAQRNFPQDAVARPFTLKMPVIRQNHPLFDSMFANAIALDSPGDGRIIRNNNGVPFADSDDPQTGIEALFQIATGQGLDGDGNQSTIDGGGPCSLSSITAPGTSGDVPAVTFTDSATGDEQDPDGRPMYYVRDSLGNPTQIEDPTNAGNQINCFASGNLGGVGWRNEAARFVILSSDIATVAPFSGAPPANVGNTDGTTPTVPATVGPATGPRIGTALPSAAWNSGPSANAVARFGDPAAEPSIAPLDAATVPATIAALNNLHIEVLFLGAPRIEQNQAKPNGGVDDTDPADPEPSIPGTHIPEVRTGVGPNTYSDPTFFFWTWASATSVLTGSEIVFQDTANFPNSTTDYPAVYNLATVWPRDPNRPFNDAPAPQNITNHVREDLAQRVNAWVPFLNAVSGGPGGAAAVNADDIPTMSIDVTLTLLPSATFDTNFVQGTGAAAPAPVNVQIPVYVAGTPVPASAPAQFEDLGYLLADASPPSPFTRSDTLQYRITADIAGIVINPGASNSDVALELARQLEAKKANWLQTLGDTLVLTDASLAITLEKFPLNVGEAEVNEIVLQTLTEGCGFMNVTLGDGGPTQIGAPCNPFGP